MSKNKREDATTGKAAGNNKERYSIWPVDRENARGQKRGLKTETSKASSKKTGSKKTGSKKASGETTRKSRASSKKSTKSKK